MSELPSSYTGPGLMDIQLNGYGGFDFNGDPAGYSAEQLHRIAEALQMRGIVAVLATLITDDVERVLARAAGYAKLLSGDTELTKRFPKLHIEGPFLSPEEGPRGAHPQRFCIAPVDAPDLIDRLRNASGDRIGMVTVAPELDGALELIARCREAGIVPAIGHTQASPETIRQAVAAGAALSTHLGNGSHDTLPRLDNYIHRQLADDNLHASFIPDGHHMPFTTLKNFIRAKTPARSILISDAINAAGMAPGRYTFGQSCTVEVSGDGRVTQVGATNLAGSALTLDRAVINVCRHCDVSFKQAWEMASTNPARLVGLQDPPTITVEISDSGFVLQNAQNAGQPPSGN